MPWYIFNTSQGQRQLLAANTEEAKKIFFQQTGITADPVGSTTSGDDNPIGGIAFLPIGSGGTGGLNGDGGAVGGGGGTVTPGPDDEELQADFQRAAYMQGIKNAGYSPTGALSGYLKDRFAPTAANFWANNILAQGRGEDRATDFQTYSQANAGGGANLYATALDKFKQIAGGAPLGVQGALDDPTNAAIRGVVAGTGVGGYDNDKAKRARAELARLANYGARSQYGPWGTSILPSDERLREKFEEDLYAHTAGAAGSTQGLNWATFLKQALGLR